MNHNPRYSNSTAWLERAEKTIPLGSQTFSKSKICYPEEVSPLYLSKGSGAKVWDIDGNQYIDFVNGLLSVSLGYCDPDVDNAVCNQIKNGVTFSLPHTLEVEVSELLVQHIPCAEMVRFGKNGSDATSAAIRLARAYTNKEHVAVCGYHGWQDWYIGSTTRSLGVPEAVKALTHSFQYNDLSSLQQIFDKQSLAAVIIEPMNLYYPNKDFLKGVQQLCQQNNTVLIFDETITGFRFSLGGAQQLFGVIPDLATFGKGMANGYPISAVVGKQEIMETMSDIFFSGTFAGETLSLAAAKATINKIVNHKVIEHIVDLGKQLEQGLKQIMESMSNPEWLSVTGHPSWLFVLIDDCKTYTSLQLKSLFLQEMQKRGFLINGGHNLSFSHQQQDIDQLLSAYQEVLPLLAKTIEDLDLDDKFNGKFIEPVFKVR
ncbi:aminotransferase class III-fold pyridoxal phosphate-dependent enzyme [Endozoicomonas sp. G2_1]|uniref:aminotransferase class III-fold pyridoxal phosphate-dependent enzyme n=1 Tax=Endozoicomonas sp. G2_1 TaxID=2821091 RepID=UPI001ADA3F36|nr:aminotransferase class III-fold pyridoxal phosphate-dependent enzyme [Endozoicomonas sp. G2_1]MBO9489048.1 aminotransferase class III-fold pyridoxal phosphate-dependent enzyme [Endozoicomonas sp. G2_1]